MTELHFVHCWDCLLPSSPSGRRVWVDGMETRGEAVVRVCRSVTIMRKVEAANRAGMAWLPSTIHP